jgi:hypothetical protein
LSSVDNYIELDLPINAKIVNYIQFIHYKLISDPNAGIKVDYIKGIINGIDLANPSWTKTINFTHSIVIPLEYNNTHTFIGDYLQELWIAMLPGGTENYGIIVRIFGWGIDDLLFPPGYITILTITNEDWTFFNQTIYDDNYRFWRKIAPSSYEVKLSFEIISRKSVNPTMPKLNIVYILGAKAYGPTTPNLTFVLLDAAVIIFPQLIILLIVPMFFYSSFDKSLKALGIGFFASGMLFIALNFGNILANMLSILIGLILLLAKKDGDI